MKKMIKRFLARKNDWEELTQTEVRAALRRKEIEHTKELDAMRLEQLRLREKFETDLKAELDKIKKELEKSHKEEIGKISKIFADKNLSLESEIKEMKVKVKFAQKFWQILYAEKDELHNVAIILQSKADLSLKSERDELQARVNKRAEDMKQVSICVQQIETIARRIERQSEFGDKLMGLLPEDTYEEAI